MADRRVDVVVQIGSADVAAGRMWSHRRRSAESATFSYADGYLARGDAYELDPALPLIAGQQQTPASRALFGAFTDCAPDRWGRRLIDRAEERRARGEDRQKRGRGEIDYLLGVRDDLRQGALRFRDPETGAYLAAERSGVPALLDLSHLLHAAERLERDEASEEELRALLRGGSSLGGARPKAHVTDRDGRLAIAKFPSPNDDWNVTRWEAVALRLARDAGLDVPDWTIHLADEKPVLVVSRFDRADDRRIGYMSAMSMLEATDGDEGSYVDIAEVIERTGADATHDLQQLWRRIAFSILISNTDDHLRNHGFLRTSTAGWRLSPAFDLNPNPDGGPKYLSTAIDGVTTEANIAVLLGVADLFRLSDDDARAVLREVAYATRDWRTAAEAEGLSREEVESMAPAFEHDQVDAAHAVAR